jgi:branched-chain amino acid transport system ATP-binding protein
MAANHSAHLLEVTNLNVYYGAIHALKGIDFYLDQGEIVALIGANGAGKSTTLNTISGLLRPRTGSVIFKGENISQTLTEQIVHKGIVQVPEGRKIFATLSVTENLEMGAFTRNNKDEFQKNMQRSFERFPRLNERRAQLGGTLSGGEQQMLAIARGLMSSPTVLLLDEPSMGLSPLLVEQIFNIIRDINDQGVSILLVEQNAQMALSIADRAYVLETGQVTLEGPAQELLHNDSVIEAYLGGH